MKLLVFGFLFVISSCYSSVDIGNYLKICVRNSPDVNDCLVDAIQNGLSVVAGGIKEIGVPSVDPFFQKEVRFDYKNNQIRAKMSAKDTIVRGLKDSTVRDVRLRADDDIFHMEVDMYSAAISVSGKYEGGGSYNDLNVTAYGDYVTNMTDLVYTWKLDGKPETIGDDVYIRITSFYMRPDVSNMNVYLSNESPNSKDLTELGVRLVNQNWRILYKELLPFAQNNWNKNGIKVANKIFLKVPYNKIFPNN